MREQIESTELLEFREKGMTVTELARHFKCSKANISKRLKRLIPLEIPASLKNLTSKQRAFVLAKASGISATAAAFDTYDCVSREAAKVVGRELMQRSDIERAISEVMQEHGLTKAYRVKKLKSHVDHKSADISLKALDQSWKLDGSYLDKHIHVVTSIEELSRSFSELRQQRRELEKELGIVDADFEELDKPEEEESYKK